MKGLNGSAFKNLTMLEELWLQDNNFTELPPNLFQDLKSLKELYLSNNKLKSLPDGLFNSLSKLTYLDLSNNELENLPAYAFKNIRAVKFLKMEYNKIKKLHEDQFQGLVELLDLYLSENKIEALPDKIFKGVKKLRSLNIFGNRIQNVTSTTFNYAHELRMLFMHYNLMAELPKGFFKHLTHIIRVTLDTNLMCCHLDLFRQDADCEYSFNDNFASCHSMFRHHAPRRTLWIVGLLSLLGSLFVVGWQYFYPDNNVVQSIMLVNLGVSDGIMGIYLIIIGIKDLQWSGEYYLHDYEWRTGWFCHFNGAMSVFSSEVSVMMISLIALDRLKNIVFPYTFAKITPRQTRIMCVVIWLVGGVMAFLPLSGMHYFSERYYGNNVVCLPLQLSPELQEGWEYSTSIFIVLNFSLFIFIMVAYVAILWKSWSSSRRLGAHGTVREIRARAQSAQAKRERALAKRVFFIILTDFLCWMPIIAIGIRSHVEKTFDPPGDLAVWIAVFALPINSAINPLLYTLSTPQVQPVLKAKLRKLWSNVRSIFSRGQNQEGFRGGIG
nr:G-protein coupled receptor GRL101-like [Pocillopora verrucosa]